MKVILKYFIFSQDKITLLLCLYIFLSIIGLLVSHNILKKKEKGFGIWRLFCIIPLILCIIHYFFYRFSSWELTDAFYGPMYFSAIAIAVLQFFYNRKWGYLVLSIIVAMYVFVQINFVIIETATTSPIIANYTRASYEESFKGIIKEMKEHYCLNNWKEIDYDFLEKTIMPKVIKAEKEQNEVDFCIALCEYCYYFYDGHVSLNSNNEKGDEIYKKAKEKLAGNDYGFSMIGLNNGDTIAIMVDEKSKAYKEGIHNGTVITKWNGIDVIKAKEDIKCIYPGYEFPVKENEDILKATFLAGKGESTNQITFIDDEGEEKTVSLDSIGSYSERLDNTLRKFYHKEKYETVQEYRDANFSCKMISSDVGYLKIISEEYDGILDVMAVIKKEYPEMVELLTNRLEELEKKGMKKLIIDTRNNSGGFAEISGSVASLFTDKDFFIYSFGEYKDGKYEKIDQHYMKANGRWKDIDVVVLTNLNCMSAGDNLVNDLSKCENTTIMGLTTSNGVDQNTGAVVYVSGGNLRINYPFLLILDEDSNPLIDTKADRKTNIPLDERIPLTKETAEVIFGENERDYELECAIDYLNK